jgi:hypothetical protein
MTILPRNSFDMAYPAVVITNILSPVPKTVLEIAITIDRKKLAFWKVFSYAVAVNSTGQNVTRPPFAAALPLKDIARRLTSGNTQESDKNSRKVILKSENSLYPWFL